MALPNGSTQVPERAQPRALTRHPHSRGHRGVASGRLSPQAADAKRRQRLLFLRYQRYGDVAARHELIEAFLPLARMLAKRYERRSEPSEDLVQVASLGLVKAIDRFDIERGNEFSSYAVPTILGELRRHFRDSGWALHVPRGMQERVLALGDAVEQLSADLGTSPTPRQIAEHLGVDTEEVLEAMAAAAAHDTVSLDAPLRPHQEGDDATIADGIGALETGFDLAEHRSAIALALKALRPRERLILELRFAEDLTQSEIAQRLGISQMHVSRLIRASLDRIRAQVGES
jgi:RNA polymerase sigma-B factor